MLPAVICALACVICNQSRLLFIFSLMPIGIACFMYSSATCWLSVVCSIVLYAASLLILHSQVPLGLANVFLRVGIFSLLNICFAWVIAPPAKGPGFLRGRTSVRLIIGSCIIFLGYVPSMYYFFQQDDFYIPLLRNVDRLLSIALMGTGGDVVQQSLLEEYFTPDTFVNSIVFVGLRGVGVVSIMFFLYLSRQVSLVVMRLVRRVIPVPELANFKTGKALIWVLSFSILAVLVSLYFSLEIPEIIAWNVFSICVMLYIAQGGGIVSFFLNRPGTPRVFRLITNICVIAMILRFSVLVIALVCLTFLGILENWVPLRVPKTNGPSSTPGM